MVETKKSRRRSPGSETGSEAGSELKAGRGSAGVRARAASGKSVKAVDTGGPGGIGSRKARGAGVVAALVKPRAGLKASLKEPSASGGVATTAASGRSAPASTRVSPDKTPGKVPGKIPGKVPGGRVSRAKSSSERRPAGVPKIPKLKLTTPFAAASPGRTSDSSLLSSDRPFVEQSQQFPQRALPPPSAEGAASSPGGGRAPPAEGFPDPLPSPSDGQAGSASSRGGGSPDSEAAPEVVIDETPPGLVGRLKRFVSTLFSPPADDPESENPPAQVTLKKLVSEDRLISYGGMIALGGMGVFLAWAFFAPLSEGVIASGQISVESRRKTIQHLEGGIVAKLHVEEGSEVAANDLLVELDQTQPMARFTLLQARLYNTLALRNRLQLETGYYRLLVEGRTEEAAAYGNQTIQFDPELLRAGEIGNPVALEVMSQQTDIYQARREQITGQIVIQTQRIRQLREQISGIEAQLRAAQTQLSVARAELSRIEGLRRNNLTTQKEWSDQVNLTADLEGRLGSYESEIARIQVAISESEQQLLQIPRQVQQEIANNLLEAQETYFELREEIVATEDVVRRTEIRAPQAGTVFGLRIFTEGGVIPPAQPILDIVPTDDQLIIEAQVRTTDVDSVYTGLPVRIVLTAFPARSTPELMGVVDQVSADAQPNEITGEPFYIAQVTVSQEELDKLDPSLKLLPGMPVELFVEGGQRTAIQYLTAPITDVVRRSLTE